jgi:hypothetical protein
MLVCAMSQAIYVCSYYCYICVLVLLLCMCPRTTATYVSSYYCYVCVLILLLCVSCVLVLLLHMCPPLLQAWPHAAQLRDVTCVPLCMGAHYYCYICVLILLQNICVLILLLCMCCVSSHYYYMREQLCSIGADVFAPQDVAGNTCMYKICVRMLLLYMCPDTSAICSQATQHCTTRCTTGTRTRC